MIIDRFTSRQVAKLSGLGPRTLDSWAIKGFLVPSVAKAKGPGTKRLYSFSDLVAARVAQRLRADRIPTVKIRRIVESLRNEANRQQHPLAEARLIVSGRDVLLVKSNDELISQLSRPGQQCFSFVVVDIGRVVEELEGKVNKLHATAA